MPATWTALSLTAVLPVVKGGRQHVQPSGGHHRDFGAARSCVAGCDAEGGCEQPDDGGGRGERVWAVAGGVGCDMGQGSQDDGRYWLDLFGALAENPPQHSPQIP